MHEDEVVLKPQFKRRGGSCCAWNTERYDGYQRSEKTFHFRNVRWFAELLPDSA